MSAIFTPSIQCAEPDDNANDKEFVFDGDPDEWMEEEDERAMVHGLRRATKSKQTLKFNNYRAC